MSSKSRHLRIHHTYKGRSVMVFDDFLTTRLVGALGQFIVSRPYERRPSFDNELSAALENELYESLPELPEALDGFLLRHYKDASEKRSKQLLSHCYCAAMRYGDQTQIHQDINCPDCMTFLYYGNTYWEPSWGGETIFFDDEHNAMFAVTPRPGRAVLFNAQLYHRTGIPMRDCPAHRYGLSVFFRCSVQLNGGVPQAAPKPDAAAAKRAKRASSSSV